jgi:hypothetical protein
VRRRVVRTANNNLRQISSDVQSRAIDWQNSADVCLSDEMDWAVQLAMFEGMDSAGIKGLWVTDGSASGTYELTGIAGAYAGGLFGPPVSPAQPFWNMMNSDRFEKGLAAAGLSTHLHVDHVGWNTQLRERALGADISQGEICHGRPRVHILDTEGEGRSVGRPLDN